MQINNTDMTGDAAFLSITPNNRSNS